MWDSFASGPLATSSQADTIRLWDSETGAPQDPIQLGGGVRPAAMTFSADGLRLLAAAGSEIQCWDMTTRQRIGNQAWDQARRRSRGRRGRPVRGRGATNGTVTPWQRNTSWYTLPTGASDQHRLRPGRPDGRRVGRGPRGAPVGSGNR
ncbi:hypothetical protein ACPZ19_50820 [Amycolatopsis lurida]